MSEKNDANMSVVRIENSNMTEEEKLEKIISDIEKDIRDNMLDEENGINIKTQKVFSFGKETKQKKDGTTVMKVNYKSDSMKVKFAIPSEYEQLIRRVLLIEKAIFIGSNLIEEMSDMIGTVSGDFNSIFTKVFHDTLSTWDDRTNRPLTLNTKSDDEETDPGCRLQNLLESTIYPGKELSDSDYEELCKIQSMINKKGE